MVHSSTLQLTKFPANRDPTVSRLGLRPTHEWNLYHFNSIPGLIVIPNPFIAGGQLHWVARCLLEYPCKPNICNLDAHRERSGDGRLWPKLEPPESLVSSRVCQAQIGAVEDPEKAQLKLSVERGVSVSKESDLYRLRWVTLGYHYDWNTKEYYKERWSPFPADLGEMATAILRVCGFSK